MFLGSVAASVTAYFNAVVYNLKFPYNTFLFLPSVMFTDFYEVFLIACDNNPYLNGANKSMYFPFANFLLNHIMIFGVRYMLKIYIIMFFVFVFCFLYIEIKKISYYALIFAAILTFCNYPILAVVDRANIEGLLFALTVLYFVFMNKNKDLLAALCLSIPVACKAYCIVYIFFALSQKKNKVAVYVIIFTGALTLFSLATFKGGFFDNLRALVFDNSISQNEMFLANNFTYPAYSLFSLIKIILIKTNSIFSMDFSRLRVCYFLISIFIVIFNITYVLFSKSENWKKLFVLTVTIIIIPPVSAVYKLLYVFIPIYYFIGCQSKKKSDIIYLAMFCFLVIPFQYGFFSDIRTDAGKLSMIIPVKTLLLVLLNVQLLFFFLLHLFQYTIIPAMRVFFSTRKGIRV
jgi:hypothetical protein